MSEQNTPEWLDRVSGSAATLLLGKTSTWNNVRDAIRAALDRHIPKPDSIRLHDVVQVFDTEDQFHLFIGVAIKVKAESVVLHHWSWHDREWCPDEYEFEVPITKVVRLCRAKFSSDGTPVED